MLQARLQHGSISPELSVLFRERAKRWPTNNLLRKYLIETGAAPYDSTRSLSTSPELYPHRVPHFLQSRQKPFIISGIFQIERLFSLYGVCLNYSSNKTSIQCCCEPSIVVLSH